MSSRPVPNEIVVPHVLREVDPAATAHQGGLDAVYGLGLRGALSYARIGMPSGTTGVGRYNGDLGPLQSFGVGRFAGATTSVTRSLNANQQPGNPGVQSQVNPVLAAMVTNQAGI